MRALLDTHILLWALTDDVRLPPVAKTIICDASNAIFHSAASSWEIAIKHALHPDRMLIGAAALLDYCREAGFQSLPVMDCHVLALETLRRPADVPRHHDPFDRIMVSQAKADDLIFITHDALIGGYEEPCILMV